VLYQYARQTPLPGTDENEVQAAYWGQHTGSVPQEEDMTPEERGWLESVALISVQTQQRLDDLAGQHMKDVWESTLASAQTNQTYLQQMNDTLNRIAGKLGA
jgi:hypothetical protein